MMAFARLMISSMLVWRTLRASSSGTSPRSTYMRNRCPPSRGMWRMLPCFDEIAHLVRISGEVGVREHIHHTPGVIGLVSGHLAPDRRAHLRPGPVAADDVAGPDGAFLTGALAGGVADGDG